MLDGAIISPKKQKGGSHMPKGIIYAMTTVVPGLVKIGKTGCQNFEQRMYNLERNGYFNVGGLKRRFAIEVDDYDEKEALIDDIFSKSRVPGSELFALDIDLVVQLLSSLEGRQIYPETESKEAVFDQATEERSVKSDWSRIPDGIYHMSRKVKGIGLVQAQMAVKNGTFIVKAGARCLEPKPGQWLPEARRSAPIVNGILTEDVECASPSTAGYVILAHSTNGWMDWRDEKGKPINQYRTKSSA